MGVKGDLRSYHPVLALRGLPTMEHIEVLAPALVNRRSDISRVISVCGMKSSDLGHFRVYESTATSERLDLLRKADAIVRAFCLETGFEDKVWQFPVVLLPLGVEEHRESVVFAASEFSGRHDS